MRSLLAGTPAGRKPRGFMEEFLGAGTEMIGGIREGEAAKQEALAKIEQRRGTAEMGDIEAYRKMEAADEEAAFKSELAMIKDVHPEVWKAEQKEINKITKAGGARAMQLAKIQEMILDAKSKMLAAQNKGLKIKAADFNAARGIFQEMLNLGKFRGKLDKNGRLTTITMVGKQALNPETAAKLGEILEGTMRRVRDQDMVEATRYIRVEFDRMTFQNVSTAAELAALPKGTQFFDVATETLRRKPK
jgi:hypothetical protein